MLVALTVLLMAEKLRSRSKVRVVFIPDCGMLLQEPLYTLKTALIAAFVDDAQACSAIAQYTGDQLGEFCRRRKASMIFILDNFNALPLSPGRERRERTDEAERQRRVAAELLNRCTLGQFRVQATSINDENKEAILAADLPVKKFGLYGGLTEVSPVTTQHWVTGCAAPLC